MRTKITTQSTKIIVRHYNKTGFTDTIQHIGEFINRHKQNVINAYNNWLVENEESLPVSILGKTHEQTRKNMFKYFLKNFCINFNNYAYVGYIHRIDNREGMCYCRSYAGFENYESVVKEIPYVHVLAI